MTVPTYSKRPRKILPPPLAGGGEQSPLAIVRGRGRSRQLRSQSSEAELKLWFFLRRKQVNGLRFRRQYQFGPYYPDFVCLPARLVVEVDGEQHGVDSQITYDERRTAWFNRNNFGVIRFWGTDVMKSPQAVLDQIEAVLRTPPPKSLSGESDFPPSRKGRGE